MNCSRKTGPLCYLHFSRLIMTQHNFYRANTNKQILFCTKCIQFTLQEEAVSVRPFFPMFHVWNCSVYYDHQVLSAEFDFTGIDPVQLVLNFIDYLSKLFILQKWCTIWNTYLIKILFFFSFCGLGPLACSSSEFNFEILNECRISWTGSSPSQTDRYCTNTERT